MEKSVREQTAKDRGYVDLHEHIEELIRDAGLLTEGTLYDLHNVSLVHHVNQALRAHIMFQRDRDYIVKDNQVIIIDEFQGTGNSELHLERRLVEKRGYPAIDIAASGTRREELLMDSNELNLIYRLRKVLADMNVVEAMELLKGRLQKVKTNAEFLLTMNLD